MAIGNQTCNSEDINKGWRHWSIFEEEPFVLDQVPRARSEADPYDVPGQNDDIRQEIEALKKQLKENRPVGKFGAVRYDDFCLFPEDVGMLVLMMMVESMFNFIRRD